MAGGAAEPAGSRGAVRPARSARLGAQEHPGRLVCGRRKEGEGWRESSPTAAHVLRPLGHGWGAALPGPALDRSLRLCDHGEVLFASGFLAATAVPHADETCRMRIRRGKLPEQKPVLLNGTFEALK